MSWRAPVNEPLRPNSWQRSGGAADYRVTSPYGPRSDGFHAALDIGNGRLGGPVFATEAGRVLAVGFLGCTTTPTNHPCASCVDGVASVKKGMERHAFCVVNGKQVDCTKNPSECPNCAKAK